MKTFNAPTEVYIPRVTMTDKKIRLNLNVYRNTHHQENNQVKAVFTALMEDQLKGVKLKTPIDIEYKLFRKTKRLVDKSNICAVVDKFFCDALQFWNCIENDNDNFIESITFLPTEYKTGADNCQITIFEGV